MIKMTSKFVMLWFGIVSILLVAWGIVFAFLGLGILPVINKNVLLPWESALYGSILMGWGTTLFIIGRIALRRKDKALMSGLLYGLTFWLVVEALFSLYYGVWFNAGVDAVVYALFIIPLIKGILGVKAHGEINPAGNKAGNQAN